MTRCNSYLYGFVGPACLMLLATTADLFAQAPLTTEYTYQGQLKQAGISINGLADLQFSLWDAEIGGNQVGLAIVANNVTVSGGLFTVPLDFGGDAFNGEGRWLQIDVRFPSGGGLFSALSPRQPVTAAPYALQTRGMFVDDNNNVDLVGTFFVDPDSSFVGVGRDTALTSSEFFGVNAPVGSGNFGGMYVRTDDAEALPFYGYSTAGEVDAYHYYDGFGDRWNLYVGGTRMTVDRTTGNVGIGDLTPDARLDVAGSAIVTGTLSKGAGSFRIDHPLDPDNKYLYHSFVESPDMMNIYNGNAVLDDGGEATVTLPDWFEALNRDFRYQLTAIGAPGPDLHVAGEIERNQFTIAGGRPGMTVSWQVTGIRHDPFANAHRIPVEEDKPEEERGKFLHAESWGRPASLSIDWADDGHASDETSN